MIKYYNSTSQDGHKRIAVVNWFDDEPNNATSRFGHEIRTLPEGFDEWKEYDRFGYDDCTIVIMSIRGE